MTTAKLSMVVGNNNPDIPLGLKVLLDGQQIWSCSALTEQQQITHDFEDIEGPHELEITMFGKLPEHTKMDGDQIVSDAMLYVQEFVFDDLDITDFFVQKNAEYLHDCNGTQPMQSHPFYRDLGCNGTVKIKFNSPVYIWILEQI